MIFHDVEQNTDEWLQLRCGKPTSSSLACIMANYGKGFGDPAKRYAAKIALEQVTGKPVSSGFSNDHMDRGHIQEPLARMAYENEMFCEVLNGGFFDSGNFGCSPDGRVAEKGRIEIKSAIFSVHLDRIESQTFDKAYKWQLVGNMKFTGAEWIDFVSYCEDFPIGKQLYIVRLHAKDYAKEYEMIDLRLNEFSRLIYERKQAIINNKYSILEQAA